MIFIDDLGNELNFDKKPKRIISLVPAITETLYDLNLEELIIGVTKECTYPIHFKSTKQIVGDTKTIELEILKELKPDLVFCNTTINSLEIITKLQKVTKVYITKVITIDDSKQMIKNLGILLNRRTEADLLNRKIDLKLEDFKLFITSFNTLKVAYFTGYNPWIATGNKTYTNSLLSLNKYTNIYNAQNYLPKINPKRIRHDGDPEILFFPSKPFTFEDQHAFEISEYTNRSSAVFIDGEMFGWFGSRLIKAFEYFKTLRNRLDEGSSFLK